MMRTTSAFLPCFNTPREVQVLFFWYRRTATCGWLRCNSSRPSLFLRRRQRKDWHQRFQAANGNGCPGISCPGIGCPSGSDVTDPVIMLDNIAENKTKLRPYSVCRSMGSRIFSCTITNEKEQTFMTSRYMGSPGTGKLSQGRGSRPLPQRRQVKSGERYLQVR